MKTINLGVHDFVDLLLRKGDLDNRIFNTMSMEEGTRLHSWYQDKQGEEYASEVFLSHDFEIGEYLLSMSGRADGIISHGNANVTIDEIKTTNTDIDEFYKAQKDWHLGQGCLYAYIYLLDHKLDAIKVQLTYISQLDTTKIKQYLFLYSKQELEAYVTGLLKQYESFLIVIDSIKQERQESIKGLAFPFPTLRNGQQEMMDFAEETIKTGQIGFCEARTGIGKTISTLYPYIKGLYEHQLEKIFYLTSKNSIKQVAYETISMLNDEGGKLKAVFMTSKERICLNSKKRHCNPDECIYAKNYYDKVNAVIFAAIKEKNLFRTQDIVKLASDNQICPFELQLDLLNYVDIIVGDYNYLFDPRAHLIRFFQTYESNPYLLLVDEGHDLPGRVRDMFSSTISYDDVSRVIASLKKEKKRGIKAIISSAEEISSYFETQKIEKSSSKWELIKEEKEIPDALADAVEGFLVSGRKYLKAAKEINDDFLNFYYECQAFDLLPPLDSRYAYYFTFDPNNKSCQSFSISCLDSRYLIKAGYGAFKAGVVFSATLTPKDYFIDLLGGSKDSMTLYLPSPFKEENCLVIVNPFVSTLYKSRDDSLGKIIDNILTVVSKRVGNYFIFFPSYSYMMKFKPFFDTFTAYDCYYQSSLMSENDRTGFLAHFHTKPQRTTLGFIVLGGIFAEGIDLADDRLIGAIIISVGLPKMSYLSDKLMNYFGSDNPDLGYAYAYIYPGINRVFQAAGRVIRGENDKGVILYIDARYAYALYKKNLKQVYNKYSELGSSRLIGQLIAEFWRKNKDE